LTADINFDRQAAGKRVPIQLSSRMSLLFSYGTLREEPVQLSTFGRPLVGEADELPGFEQTLLKIDDPEFVAASGKSHHAIVRFTGRSGDSVSGTVFEVTDDELARADAYEPAGYTRMRVVFRSGREGWVYADASTRGDA
jgi:hypothetical protein